MITSVRPSDYRLLNRFAFDGDEAAFEELVRRHAGMARGVCRRVLGPAGDAEDAAQTAFLSLAKHARPLALRLGPTGSLAGWIYRVAVNAALQQRRAAKARRRREATVVRERDDREEGVSGGVERSELLVVLDEELKELPPRYRTPLVLCHLEGKTQQEAAEQLGLSYGTLRRRLDRGRKLLKARIGRRGVVTTPAMLVLIWKASAVEAANAPVGFVKGAVAATRGGQPSVAIVRPRIASSGRVAGSSSGWSGSVSAIVYSTALAAILMAMVVPPVVSMIASAAEPSPRSVESDRPPGSWPSFPIVSPGESAR